MKFSIRDLMFVTAIVAILVAWGLDYWRLRSGMRQIYDAAERMEAYFGGPQKGFLIPRPEDF